MKRMYVTLMNRVEQPDDTVDTAGELVVLDWDQKKVIKRLAVNPSSDVSNKIIGGRSRGAAGLDFLDGKLCVSCSNWVMVYDPDTYEFLEDLSLVVPDPAGVHQMKTHGEELWIVCAGGDLKRSYQNGKIGPPTYVGSQGKDTLHFNSLGWDSAGDEYHIYMTKNKLINYSTGQTICTISGMPHDLCFINNDEVLVSQSAQGKLIKVNVRTGSQTTVFSHPVDGTGVRGYRIQGFMRGIAFHKDTNSVFLGIAPGKILQLDGESWKVKNEVSFCDIVNTTVYDLALSPEDWS